MSDETIKRLAVLIPLNSGRGFFLSVHSKTRTRYGLNHFENPHTASNTLLG